MRKNSSLFTLKDKEIKTKKKIRTYCTSENRENIKLNPWFVTGLSDGDGSLYITIRKDSTCRFGFSTSLEYKVVAGVNPLNLKLLELVQSFFKGVGIIHKDKNTYQYVIRNRNHLSKVREHFDNYPLQTTKHLHFKLWSKVLHLVERKDHLTVTGFMEVLAIKALFPNGLNDSIKAAFPDINSIIKPEFISNTYKLNGHWIAGFTQADGSFGLNYSKATKMRLGYTCQPQFRISQHERDLIVLNRIIEYLGCGILRNTSKIKYEWTVSVSNNTDLVNIVIPFFQKYSIYGAKQSDFLDFSKGMHIINNKGHLTPEGLNELNKIAYGMNSYRKF
jgi:hypothetical protein